VSIFNYHAPPNSYSLKKAYTRQRDITATTMNTHISFQIPFVEPNGKYVAPLTVFANGRYFCAFNAYEIMRRAPKIKAPF